MLKYEWATGIHDPATFTEWKERDGGEGSTKQNNTEGLSLERFAAETEIYFMGIARGAGFTVRIVEESQRDRPLWQGNTKDGFRFLTFTSELPRRIPGRFRR